MDVLMMLAPAGLLALTVFLLMAVRTAVVAGSVAALIRLPMVQRFRIYRVPHLPGQFFSELRATCVVMIFDAAIFVTVNQLGLLHKAIDPSLWAILATAFLAFVWYEVWFYATHRLLHSRHLYRFHAQHHVARVTDPLTALSFGLVERAILLSGLLVPLLIISHWQPIPLAGVMLYGFFNYLFNTLGHANHELIPVAIVRHPLIGRLVTATYHSMHHARMNGHFGLFTTVLDERFGTAFSDYPQIHARVRAGCGPQRLGERAD